MKKVVIFIFIVNAYFFGCAQKPGSEFIKYDGYYYMDITLKNFSDYSFPNGENFSYVQFDQSLGRIRMIDAEHNVIKEFPVELASGTELVLKLDKPIYFIFRQHNGSGKIMTLIRFYKELGNPDKSFLNSGYRSDNVKSIEDAKAEIERYREENKIFEENLPPGQE